MITEYETFAEMQHTHLERQRKYLARRSQPSGLTIPAAVGVPAEEERLILINFTVTATDAYIPVGSGAVQKRVLANHTTSPSASQTDFSVTPTGYSVGDELYFFFGIGGGASTHTQLQGPTCDLVADTGDINNQIRGSVWHRKATSVGDLYAFNCGLTNRRGFIGVLALHGTAVTPIEGTVDASGVTGVTSFTHPADTAGGGGRLRTLFTFHITGAGLTQLFNTPAGFDEDFDICTAHATSSNAHGGVHTDTVGAGSTGTTLVNGDDAVARTWAGVTVLFAPSIGGALFTETNRPVTILVTTAATDSGGGLPMPLIGHQRGRQNLTTTQEIAEAEATYGPFNGDKALYRGTSVALGFDAEELALIDAGHTFHLYNKVGLPWSTVVAGNHDARLTALANALKSRPAKRFRVTFHHEPEGELNSNGGTAGTHADFRNMWNYCRNFLITAGVTNADYTWVMTHSANKPADLPLLWPGNGTVDIVGIQRYIRCETAYTELAIRFLQDLQWFWDNYAPGTRNWRPLKADGTGDVEFRFTEWGADLGGNPDPCGVGDRGTATRRGQAIDEVRLILPELAEWGVGELKYFDVNTVSTASNWLEEKPQPDALSYQALYDAMVP